jgi:ribosomal protein S18 acetylase RimI-like enzyme
MSIQIEGPYFEKSHVCTPIIRSLEKWFGIEEAIVHYSNTIDHLPTWLASDGNHVVGFLSIKQHTPFSAEVYVMGILIEAHHRGIGRALIEHSQEWLRGRHVEYLQVKTLGPSDPDESYAKTRAFYEAVGFRPMEEFKQLWDADNPCLIMIKKL